MSKSHAASSLIARGLALFLGGFALLNLLGSLKAAGFDANIWWIDLRAVPPVAANALILVSSLCLISFALVPPVSTWRKFATALVTALLSVAALENAVQFYVLRSRHSIQPAFPIPLSLLLGAVLLWILFSIIRIQNAETGSKVPRFGHRWLAIFGVCVVCSLAFPLAQMFCFGKTGYRRLADVAVVLGCRVYADGPPSDALSDRVRTACQLYRDGFVKKLLFSGGPGDGTVHETEAMKRMAVASGVNPADILVDRAGLNTQATARNTEAICSKLHYSRVLVVSHFYHLPRIKLAYQRDGWDVYTIPAKESYLLRQMPYNIAREVAALWVYYLRPLA